MQLGSEATGYVQNAHPYGLIFLFENGSSGNWGIFGCVGPTLTKIASHGYELSGGTFTIAVSQDKTFSVKSNIQNGTRHGVLFFAGS